MVDFFKWNMEQHWLIIKLSLLNYWFEGKWFGQGAEKPLRRECDGWSGRILAGTHISNARLNGLNRPLQKSLGQVVRLLVQVLHWKPMDLSVSLILCMCVFCKWPSQCWLRTFHWIPQAITIKSVAIHLLWSGKVHHPLQCSVFRLQPNTHCIDIVPKLPPRQHYWKTKINISI